MGLFRGHLPLLRLPPGQADLSASPGVLRALSFDDWRAMDQSFPYRDTGYERTAPVFFELEAPDFATGVAALHTLYRAALLVTCERLPQPELSTAYLVHGDGVERRAGPCEHEMIVFGDQHPSWELSEEIVAEMGRVQGLLTDHGDALTSLLEALVRTTRPGFTPLNATLHLTGGLEALLVRFGEPLKATFARRYSALAADDDPLEYEALGKAVYDLRSDLIHGRQIKNDDSGREAFLDRYYRPLVCEMTLRALTWFAEHPGGSLPDALDGGAP